MDEGAGIVGPYERELVAPARLDRHRTPVSAGADDEVRDRIRAGALAGGLVDRPHLDGGALQARVLREVHRPARDVDPSLLPQDLRGPGRPAGEELVEPPERHG